MHLQLVSYAPITVSELSEFCVASDPVSAFVNRIREDDGDSSSIPGLLAGRLGLLLGLAGGDGDDFLIGGDGDDILDGGADDNTLEGDSRNDKLYDGDGNDTLDGGADSVRDTLTGGAGKDVFVASAADGSVLAGADLVTDFA